MALPRTEGDPGEYREHQPDDREAEHVLHDSNEEWRAIGKTAICLCRTGHGVAIDDRQSGENEHAADGHGNPRLCPWRGANVHHAQPDEKWIRAAQHGDDADADGAARSRDGVGLGHVTRKQKSKARAVDSRNRAHRHMPDGRVVWY